jgi:hypothetical protein
MKKYGIFKIHWFPSSDVRFYELSCVLWHDIPATQSMINETDFYDS